MVNCEEVHKHLKLVKKPLFIPKPTTKDTNFHMEKNQNIDPKSDKQKVGNEGSGGKNRHQKKENQEVLEEESPRINTFSDLKRNEETANKETISHGDAGGLSRRKQKQ